MTRLKSMRNTKPLTTKRAITKPSITSGHHEDHPHVDLTEEEAAALAEHIADAQDDDAARDAQNRVFAAADAAADAGVHEHHDDHDTDEHESHELGEHEVEEHAEDSEET